MRPAQTLRHQLLDWATDQLVRLLAVHLQALSVDVNDLTRAVDYHQGIRDDLEQSIVWEQRHFIQRVWRTVALRKFNGLSRR